MLLMRHRSGKFCKCKWCMEFSHQPFVNIKQFALFGAFLLSLISSDVAASIIPSVPSLGSLGYPSRVFPGNIIFILFQKDLYFLGLLRGSEYTIPIKKDDHITIAMAYQPWKHRCHDKDGIMGKVRGSPKDSRIHPLRRINVQNASSLD